MVEALLRVYAVAIRGPRSRKFGNVVKDRVKRMLARNLRALPLPIALLLTLACSQPNPATAKGEADADNTNSGEDAIASESGPVKLLSVTPNRGPLAGGSQIDLKGSGFADDARVFLGQKECEIAWRGGKTHLFAVVPPVDAPAAVDVRVQSGADASGQPREVGLKRGYTYVGETHVLSFEPLLGPATGGTQMTVHGSGFHPGDKLLIGWREATGSEVLDDGTLVALTPPAADIGAADEENAVVAVRHGSGVAVLTGSFKYGRPPKVEQVEPGVVPLQGADVTLHGRALGHADTLYAGGIAAILAGGTASDVRGATLPAMTALDPGAQPGLRDLLVDGPFGPSELSPAFAYAAPTNSAKILGVAPSVGSSAGGGNATVLVALPDGAKISTVTIGGSNVTFSQSGGSAAFVLPAHAAGVVSVAIATDKGSDTLDKAFTYVDPPVIDQILPGSGPPDGGTHVILHGSHLSDSCTVQFGTWHGQITGSLPDGSELQITTPPGPMGTVDVTVTCDGLSSTKIGGFQYTDGLPHINAVVPSQGATGGSTPVKVYGSGFQPGIKFYFGGKMATAVSVIDSGHADMLTPAHDGGVVDVTTIFSGASETLISGYNFFNPTASEGGTWGEQVGGSLNVTVLDIYTRQPVEDATVVLGQPGEPIFGKYQSVTDQAGQVVFTGADIVGPISVSATKLEYTATSIISFDARNATLLLFPYHPSGSGGGDPPPTLADPKLLGRVRDIDKYISVPPANCLKGSDAGDKTCDVCEDDGSCVSLASAVTFACIDNGPAGKRCMPDCTENNVCGSGFACYPEPSRPGHAVCKPQLGIRKVFCATSQRDMTTVNKPAPAEKDKVVTDVLPYEAVAVDESTGDYELTGRLDELAIVCVGGYVTNDTQVFVPTAMGIRRHVFPHPYYQKGDEIAHLDINLDIPLARTLPVRLDHPQPYFPVGTGGTQKVDVWFDLGSDGVVQILANLSVGGAGVTGVQDDMQLPHLPTSLPAELTDTQWIFQAVVQYGGTAAAAANSGPETGTFHEGLQTPGDENLRIRTKDGQWQNQTLGAATELTGIVLGTDDELLILAHDGRLYRGSLDKLKQIYQPPIFDPYSPLPAVLAMAGTPTDATLVGQGGLIRHLHGQKVTEESGISASTLRAVCQLDGVRVAVGDAGVIELHDGKAWTPVLPDLSEANPKSPLYAVLCTKNQQLAVGANGRLLELQTVLGVTSQKTTVLDANVTFHALVQDAQGTLWAAGETTSGPTQAALWKKVPGGQWQDGWPGGAPLKLIRGLRVLVALPDALLAFDREGGHWRIDVAGVTNESPERLDQRPRAAVALADGSAIVVSEPGTWLGPFLTVPSLLKPSTTGKTSPMQVEWSVAPGPSPSCNRVHLDGSGFPFWWLYSAPNVTSLVLPDFAAVAGIQPFPTNPPNIQWIARVDRIFIPGTTISSFSTFDLEFGNWRSWSTNSQPFIP